MVRKVSAHETIAVYRDKVVPYWRGRTMRTAVWLILSMPDWLTTWFSSSTK